MRSTISTHAALCVAAASVVGAALLVAGCGSSSPPSSTTGAAASSSASANQGASGAFKYADCMRSHGVSNFPDPVVSTQGTSTSIRQAVPAQLGKSPQFKTAQRACQGIMPAPPSPAQQAQQQHQREQILLAFASCLRSHGEPRFPDPNAQGQLPLSAVTAAGVDLQAPQVLTAAKACVSVTHGQITLAQIEQAIHGGH